MAEPALYAEILIPLALPKNFTWSVPVGLQELAQVGQRAEVVFGRNKKYAGIIKKLHRNKPGFDPKEIVNLLDDEPILHPVQLEFWEWMAQYYLCSEGEVMQAALPTHFKLSSETVLLYNDAYGEDFSALDNEEFLVAEALLIRKELRLTEIQQLLDAAHVYPVIKRLLEKGVCLVWEELKHTYKEKKETYILLHPQYASEEALEKLLNDWGDKKAPKQMELLLAYLHLSKTSSDVTQADLLSKSGANSEQLKALVTKQILLAERRTVDRLRKSSAVADLQVVLSPAQQTALDQLQEQLRQKSVCLLHGITSSGKTLLYIRLMEAAIREGSQVLYMLPEIALTAQVIRRLQQYFGAAIVIYHSRFNANERVELWNKVKSGEAKIVLGARSSVFLPFRTLGLVICDEEHDASYKQQDPAPRYHGRDAAIYLASLFKAKTVLGSATPSLESYYNHKTGKYGMVSLLERFNQLELPAIELVDTTRVTTADKSKVILSPPLTQAIADTLENNKQVILFQNRRGYSPYQVCQSCGWIPHCKQCDVSLTYHKLHHKLVCHYCGTVYAPVVVCEACGNHHFAQQNFGTERIEEALVEEFPKARVSRMDVDAVKGKYAHDALIQQFEQRRIDILVGTQMVVKGLDFDHVALVGVLDADAILGFADFRVNERAFQLMEQVSGRAGRKGARGTVLIQTRNPKHPVLTWVAQHNYEALAESELANRQQFGYPPFTRLVQLRFKHKMPDVVQSAARQFANWLKPMFGQWLVGPAAPAVNRVRNQYLVDLMIKLPKDGHSLASCREQIQLLTAHLHQQPLFKSVTVTPDIDPI